MKKSSIVTSYRFLLVKDLRLDKYQRALSMPTVKKMADEFDKNKLGTITVSKRDGKYFVVDGQHRVVLAKTLEIKGLMALVYEGLTYEEEAELFNSLNNAHGEQRRLTRADIFKASVEAKETTEVDIKNIVESLGFKITRKSRDNSIGAIASVTKVYRKYGGQGLYDILELLKKTWNGERYSLNNKMIEGAAEFLNIYFNEPHFSTKTFINQLSKIAPVKVVREANEDNTTNNTKVKMMNTLFRYYNQRLKNKIKNKHYSIG